MGPAALAFVSVTLVGAVSLAGLLTLSMSEARVRRLATLFVGFAAGALLGDTFIHLIPEIFADTSESGALRASLLILGGILLFFVVEKLLRHQHGLLHRHHHHEHVERPELAGVNILGDAIHNYIDGLLIGASWLASPALGVTTTLAVLLHEIPQELGDFGILLHSGLTVRQAALLNAGSAAVAILGTATAVLAGTVAHERMTQLLVPLTAGGFVYIAAADLIPELQHDRSLRALAVQTALIASGIAVMALLTLVE
ncbi:MAG TPA: ZIP family metal transporter [Thermoanaerobaculia bacterium]